MLTIDPRYHSLDLVRQWFDNQEKSNTTQLLQ